MIDDIEKGQEHRGPWMQTASGGRFWPLDPRHEDIHIDDIANGLAQCGRYNGQRQIDKYYSVAEHSVLMTRYAVEHFQHWPPSAYLACLMHDAPEAYINDLNRAMKKAMRIGARGGRSEYDTLNYCVERAINTKFRINEAAALYADGIKDLDQRIVQNEKEAFMNTGGHEWAFDVFEPLPGVDIECWDAPKAKKEFLSCYWSLELRRKQEEGYDE